MTEKRLENYEQTKEKALRLLEFRPHSEYELSEKLKRAGASAEDIEKTLSFCREYGFVNDERYAVSKARDLQKLKKYGKRRIAMELHHKGIPREIAEAALLELEDEGADILYPLVEKKLGGDFEKKNVDKCIRYFIYRGYDFGEIKACIDRAKNGGEDEL